MVNILYILFQVSCIILLVLISDNYYFLVRPNQKLVIQPNTNNYHKYSMDYIMKTKSLIKKNPLSFEVMEELKNKILKRKASEFEDLEEMVKFNKWNNKNNFSDIVNNKKGIILDLNSVDFSDREKFNQFVENIKFIEKKCYENSIMLFIVGEKKYYNFIDHMKYFNRLNYISPFNYSKSYFWSKPSKLEIGKISDKACNVSINDMISDISNQYGILTNDLSLINFNDTYQGINYNISNHVIM